MRSNVISYKLSAIIVFVSDHAVLLICLPTLYGFQTRPDLIRKYVSNYEEDYISIWINSFEK